MTALDVPLVLADPQTPPAAQLASTPDGTPTPETSMGTAQAYLWLLVTAAGLIAGVIVGVYAIFRDAWPEALAWGQLFVDRGWGTFIAVVLALGSVAMAMAVRSARRNDRFHLMLYLTLTLMCGLCFLGVTVIDYMQMARDLSQQRRELAPRPPRPAAPLHAVAPIAPVRAGLDLAAGERFYNMVCAACHGRSGEGMKGLGLPLRDSELVIRSTPAELSAFVKAGRSANDPKSKMNAAMLPRGGAAFLTDANVDDIVAHIKKNIAAAPEGGAAAPAVIASASDAGEDVPASFIVPPTTGPKGLRTEFLHDAPVASTSPRDACSFFVFYYIFTGLHAIHVLIGLCIVGWLFHAAIARSQASVCQSDIDVGGLYWHVMAATWLVMLSLVHF